MLISYNNTIQYQSSEFDFSQSQQLAMELAKLLHRGVPINVNEPIPASIKYDLQSGDVALEEQTVGGVNNVLSDEYRNLIIQPIKDAIRLNAQFELVNKVAVTPITNIEDTPKAINSLMPKASFTLFSAKNNANIKPGMSQAIDALKKGKINNLRDVDNALSMPNKKVSPRPT